MYMGYTYFVLYILAIVVEYFKCQENARKNEYHQD